MSKKYRPYQPKQQLLLPANLEEWLPEDHMARFLSDVVEELDLDEIYSVYEQEDRGYPPYDPEMMAKVLLYAYCVGVPSSRKIEKRLVEDVAFRYLAAGNQPDYRTIAEYRRRHLGALAGLFVQVLKLCQEAGLVKLGHVSLDGTKVKANASKHKAMSYERMVKTEGVLQKEIEELLRKAEQVDEEEDRQYGKGRRGDELPEELARRDKRLVKIREAKAALEAKAKAAMDQKKQERQELETKAREDGRTVPGVAPQFDDRPDPKAQRNFTDPESSIMKGADGFVQAYNCQAVVDAEAQTIVACEVSPLGVDSIQMESMAMEILENTGTLPEKLSADAGYWSEANIEGLSALGVESFVAVQREKHHVKLPVSPRGRIPKDASAKDRMRRKLATDRGRRIYARRKAIVEPVFGQIKGRGFRQFLLRGHQKARGEWSLICTTHNLLKLYRRLEGKWSAN